MNKPAEYRQGDSLFLIRQFEPFESLSILADLQKILGPVISGAAKAVEEKNLDKEINMIFMAKLFGGIFAELPSKLNGEQFEKLARTLLQADYISFSPNGAEKNLVKFTETVIDEYYTGRPLDLIALMIQVVKVNYLDFTKLSAIPAGWREILEGLGLTYQAK